MVIELECVANGSQRVQEQGSAVRRTIYQAKFVSAPSKLTPICTSVIGELVLRSENILLFDVEKEYSFSVDTEKSF